MARMIGTPPYFAPPPGSGSVQQGGPRGPMLRRRTIQHRRTPTSPYLGYLLRQTPTSTLAAFNRRKLAYLARYWRRNLTGAQRLAWDSFPVPGNGFDNYMQFNLVGYSVAVPLVGPFTGQNYGDNLDPTTWDFTPCQPIVPATSPFTTKTSVIMTFTGADAFTFANVTAVTQLTGRAEIATIYGTRPFAATWYPRKNPLIRLGAYFCAASGFMFMQETLNSPTTIPLKTLWERVIGGALPGQHIIYGWRFQQAVRQGRPSALQTNRVTVL